MQREGEETSPLATAVPTTAPDFTIPAKGKASVHVRYEGNNSKRWDGKVVKMDRDWMEDVCSQELVVGTAVEMPWRGKGGKMVLWKGVIVSDGDNEETPSACKKRKSKLR